MLSKQMKKRFPSENPETPYTEDSAYQPRISAYIQKTSLYQAATETFGFKTITKTFGYKAKTRVDLSHQTQN